MGLSANEEDTQIRCCQQWKKKCVYKIPNRMATSWLTAEIVMLQDLN